MLAHAQLREKRTPLKRLSYAEALARCGLQLTPVPGEPDVMTVTVTAAGQAGHSGRDPGRRGVSGPPQTVGQEGAAGVHPQGQQAQVGALAHDVLLRRRPRGGPENRGHG